MRAQVVVAVVVVGSSLPAFAQPAVTPPAPSIFDTHKGALLEVDAGIGYVRASVIGGGSSDSALGVEGPDVGLGLWLDPQLSLQLRFTAVSCHDDGNWFTQYFLGPSIQYWLSDTVWVSGGAGAAAIRSSGNTTWGWGLDLRGGYALTPKMDLSIEVNPAFYKRADTSVSFTGIAVMFGYHFF
ncbi:MAG TPA: hypothetical protein VGM88_34040 [Kofleriaceae bacterium]